MTVEADELRGHPFLPEEGVLSSIPGLYATEATPRRGKVAWLHYFCGPCDWYVVELDRESGVAFGWVDLGDPANAELGYFGLGELRELVARPRGYPVVVERDLDWTPGPLPAT